jgi:SAM-dependent methyltransferase
VHEGARAFIERKVTELGPFKRVLEIGSRNVNGSVREYFGDADYLGIDRRQGAGVDLVLDAVNWQTDLRFDAIVCCEVFEHEPRWPLLMGKISVWLEPKGVALLTMAGSCLRAGEPYENIDPVELAQTAAIHGLRAELDVSVPGDLYAAIFRWGA